MNTYFYFYLLILPVLNVHLVVFFVILFQVISLSLPAGFHWSQKLTDGPKNLNKLIHTSVFKCLILSNLAGLI